MPISSCPSRAVWRRLPSRTFFVLGVNGMCPAAGAEPAGALTPASLLSRTGAVTPHEVSAAAPGPPASRIPVSRCSVPTPVLVVGAGGAGGEDDHVTGLIGESLDHHATDSRASPHDTKPLLCIPFRSFWGSGHA